MNIQFTSNPYSSSNVEVISRGVMTDAKVAKLNNMTKRPTLVANWEKGRPAITATTMVNAPVQETKRDYSSLLANMDISLINYDKNVSNSGAKKLRVNKIVNEKASRVYNSSEKISVQVEQPPVTQQEEVVNLINQISVVEAPKEVKEESPLREDTHGRHERTGEVPVKEIRENIRNEFMPSAPVMSSRTQRNAQEYESVVREESPKQEPKAGDMDLYNDLLHNGHVDDVSRQLQGAREELSLEKEESKKLAEQYGKAVRELEGLKIDIENKKRLRAQQEKRELTETLNNIKTLKEENLARTSDLSSLKAEIAKLKAEKEAMESSIYSDVSYGRRAI